MLLIFFPAVFTTPIVFFATFSYIPKIFLKISSRGPKIKVNKFTKNFITNPGKFYINYAVKGTTLSIILFKVGSTKALGLFIT